jgi:hypothetical protein
MDWYFCLALIFYVVWCVGAHVLHLRNRLDKFDVIMASILGVPFSAFWPIVTISFVMFWVVRFLAKLVVKYTRG